jgi:hypothetical protein
MENENPEVVELSKPKRGRPSKAVLKEPTSVPTATPIVESVIPSVSMEPIEKPTVHMDEKPTATEKKPRAPRKPKAIKQEPVKVEPPKVEPPKVEPPKVEPEPVRKTVRKPKVKQEVIQEPVIVGIKSQMEQVPESIPPKRGRGRPKKVQEEQQAVRNSTEAEREDLEYRIEMVKSHIANKKYKKSKRENDYLRDKLAELERELNDLSSEEEYVPKRTTKSLSERTAGLKAQKPIRIPKENVERLEEGKRVMMTRQELMRSFGF